MHPMMCGWTGLSDLPWDNNGPGKLAVSVVVGHERYIGTRASQYARIAIREYFGNYFNQTSGKAEDRG